MTKYYILDDKNNAVESTDIDCYRWKQMHPERARIGRTEIGLADVSTVFLGMDHGWGSERELFETMIFGGDRNDEQFRYATWDEAKAGHDRVVAELQEATR